MHERLLLLYAHIETPICATIGHSVLKPSQATAGFPFDSGTLHLSCTHIRCWATEAKLLHINMHLPWKLVWHGQQQQHRLHMLPQPDCSCQMLVQTAELEQAISKIGRNKITRKRGRSETKKVDMQSESTCYRSMSGVDSSSNGGFRSTHSIPQVCCRQRRQVIDAISTKEHCMPQTLKTFTGLHGIGPNQK